jgi:hypothetical protein
VYIRTVRVQCLQMHFCVFTEMSQIGFGVQTTETLKYLVVEHIAVHLYDGESMV